MAKRKAALSAEAWRKLPPNEQADYALNDERGVYVFDLETAEGYGLDHVDESRTALEKANKALDAERKQNREAQAKLKNLDFDPDEGRKALARVKEMETWLPEEKARKMQEARDKQLEEKYGAEIKQRDTLLAERDALVKELNGDLESTLIESEATRAISAAKGKVKALLGPVRAGIKVVKDEATGRRVARVFDGDSPRISRRAGSTANTLMPIDEYVESFKSDPDFAPLFDGSGVSGSGSNGSSSRSRVGSQYSITEAEARDNPRAYAKVREAASAAGQQVQIVAP